MKKVLVLMIAFVLLSCGGDDGDDSTNSGDNTGDTEVTECEIIADVISLAHGDICTITNDDAQNYLITAGDIECDNGQLTYGGGVYSSGSGNGVTLNGLTIICALDE